MATIVRPAVTAQQVARDVRVKGASTRSIVMGVLPPTAGYAVSLPDHEWTYRLPSSDKALQVMVGLYADYYRNELTKPSHYLSAGVDGDTLYLDVSQVVPERAVALRLGRERNQQTVFDLARGEDVKVAPEQNITAEETGS